MVKKKSSVLAGLKKGFKKVSRDVSKNIKKSYKQIQDKNKLIDNLTIAEAEKVYRTWIDRSLMTEEYNPDTGKFKKVKLTNRQIKRKIFNRLSSDKIITTIPRLKKKAQTVKKAVKKAKK